MPDFRRCFVPGGTYFFTVITAGRAPLFANSAARALLGQVMRDQQMLLPFETVGVVLLPDHLHVVWTLPRGGDSDYPRRWRGIKAGFTSQWLARGGREQLVSSGYERQRRRGVWQPRFLEHTVRDEADLKQHIDYLHYNPVKHGYARCPKDWEWSSFRRYVASGEYPENWGCSELPSPRFPNVDVELVE